MKLIDLSQPGSLMPTLRFGIATDSALVLRGRPLFLPETADKWQLHISLAYRIARLGKSIPARFVSRYIDAVTLAAHAVAYGSDPYLPLNTAIDFSYAIGQWIEPQPIENIEISSHSISRICNATALSDQVNNAIATVSPLFTLKSGDIVLMPLDISIDTVEPDTHIAASINNKPILTFNIK